MKRKIKVKKVLSKRTIRRAVAALRERAQITGHLTDEQLHILARAVIETIIFDDYTTGRTTQHKEKKK